MGVSLRRLGHPLAEASAQLDVLAPRGRHEPFARALAGCGPGPLRAAGIEVL